MLLLIVIQDLIDFLPWFIATCSLIILAFIIFRSFPPSTAKREDKPKRTTISKIPRTLDSSGMTISDSELERARTELRTLLIERDIVSYALTRLFEAEAQGSITEEERERLLSKYREDMRRLEREVEEREMIVNLHELESMQSNLLEMFQRRFDDISSRIEEIRSELDLEARTGTTEEMRAEFSPEVNREIWVERTQQGEERRVSTATPPESPAEEKIRQIRREVMKDLERREQMEFEEVYDDLGQSDEKEGSD